MTKNNVLTWAPIIISALSLLASLIALIKSCIANKISFGAIEIEIRNMISTARKNLEDYTEANENPNKKRISSLMEEELNAYEEACAKYLDKKLDKKRFKKTYKQDIFRLFKSKHFKKIIFPETTSEYNSLIKVYKEFNK